MSERVVDLQEIRDTIHDWFGVDLTTEQVREILELEPGFSNDVIRHGFDTVERERFIETLATKKLGMGHWPLGGDTETYTNAFFIAFEMKCGEQGIKLRDGWSRDNIG